RGERLPRWARPSVVIRDGVSLRPHSADRPRAGDRGYILTATSYLSLLDHLFASPGESAGDSAIYSEFRAARDTPIGEVAAAYGASVAPQDAAIPIGDYLRRELAGEIEPADRVALGPLEIVVRSVNERHEIEEVGISVDPT